MKWYLIDKINISCQKTKKMPSRDTNAGVVRGTNKKVNFDSNGNPTVQWYYGGTWQFFQKGVQLSTQQVRNLNSGQ